MLGVDKSVTTNKEDKELELTMAHQVLDFVEKDFPVKLEPKVEEQIRKKYDVTINKLSRDIQQIDRHKKPVTNSLSTSTGQLLLANLEIAKFQRELLIKFHKEGSFSDESIRHAERELDIEELRLNGLIEKNEN